MKRRHFLHNLAHVAAAPTIFSSSAFDKLDFSSNSFLSNTIEDGKIIVIIKMDGGNDGLNTVIPLDQMTALSNARPHVILPENKIVSLNSSDLGLHPALSDFKTLFNEDRLKIIQNVGYPTPDFSHFRSMDIWQSASDSNQYFLSIVFSTRGPMTRATGTCIPVSANERNQNDNLATWLNQHTAQAWFS